MTEEQKQTLEKLSERQLVFEVGKILTVVNVVEPDEDWIFYLIRPDGWLLKIRFKGKSHNALPMAIRIADQRNIRLKGSGIMKSKEEVRKILDNLPETAHCKYCDVDIKRQNYGNHTRTKTHLAKVKAYKEAHPEEFEKKSKVESEASLKYSQKTTSKTSRPSKSKAKDDKPKRGSIGTRCVELLKDKSLAGKSHAELAEIIRNEFGSKTSAACLAWYQSKYRNDSAIIARPKKEKVEKKKKKVEKKK